MNLFIDENKDSNNSFSQFPIFSNNCLLAIIVDKNSNDNFFFHEILFSALFSLSKFIIG